MAINSDAGRAVVDLSELAAYGGTVAGQVVVNARKGLSARANLGLKGLALEPLLTDLAGFGRLTGTGDIRFNLLGVGTSLDALMRSLEGEGAFTLSKGEYRGFDLAGMLRAFDPTLVGEGTSTVFDSITGTFGVAGGVMTNRDLAVNALLVTATGGGQADIGAQTLDFRITPLTLAGQALDPDMQVPLQVVGPWAAPRFRLDVEAIAERKLREEAAKLEERARAEIAEKLQEELGVAPIDGESIEDTARRAAEQALQDEATKALEQILGGSGD
jgi:AsmA protein